MAENPQLLSISIPGAEGDVTFRFRTRNQMGGLKPLLHQHCVMKRRTDVLTMIQLLLFYEDECQASFALYSKHQELFQETGRRTVVGSFQGAFS